MVKMKNMLFPLLMVMGIGSAPTMQALSGAERAKIKLQLDRALQNDLPLSGQLINQLRRGGEKALAAEYAAKLDKVMADNMGLLVGVAQDLHETHFTLANAARAHAGDRANVETIASNIAKSASERVLQLANLLRKAKDYSLLGVWEPAVKAAVSQQLAVRALNEQVQDANAVAGVQKIRNAAAALAALRGPTELVNVRVGAAIREPNPVQRAPIIERVKEAAGQASVAARAIIGAMR
ncbi:hypothetical protein KJZ61_01345 [Candidatus Dependentiae bacterium]|nr:hypothetical protein [Candidatus Dependentiae bacterium]